MRLFSKDYEPGPWQYYLLILFLGIIPLFYNLGSPVLSIWDESRRAVNAYEMYENGNYLVTYFNGEPEMWGTKPPLLIWAQTLSMHIFGVNEWALRFPAALAGLLLGFLILWFSHYYTRSYLWGIISVLILYTSSGYINLHSVRTGDFDSVLILFTTAASFFLFLGTETGDKKKKNRSILGFFIMLTLAGMTKGIAAFMLGPAYLVFLLYRKELRNWLLNKYLWIGFAILLAVIPGYYLLREVFNPGYISAIISNEITGRYFDTLEDNKRPVYWYLQMLYQSRFKTWYYLIPAGLFLGYISKDDRIKHFLTYMILLTFTFLAVISIAETKLAWYDLPVFPYISMMAAVFFLIIFRSLQNTPIIIQKPIFTKFIPFFILLFFFAAPYYRIFKSIHNGEIPRQDEQIHRISHYLREGERGNRELTDPVTILYEGEFQHFLFYVYKLRDQGHNIYLSEVEEVNPGSDYVVYQEEVLNALKKKYTIHVEENEKGIYKVKVEE